MTDHFDHQITEGLRRAATDVTVPPGSFGDVRRRVRARRRRHVTAATVPAVAGLAWVGLRPTAQPAPLLLGSPTAPTAPPSSTVTTDPVTDPTTPPTLAPPDLLGADDPVAGAEALFVALGFPGERYPTIQGGVIQIVAADPERPYERRVTLTVRPGTPEVTPTTVSTGIDAERVVVSAEASDGRTYELVIIDATGRNLPSPAEALRLLDGIVP